MALDNDSIHGRIFYDPHGQTYTGHHEFDADGSLGETIVHLVSTVTDRDPLELDPLYEAIAIDALDTVLTESPGLEGELRFTWMGCPVTVHADGKVVVDFSKDARIPTD